MAGRLLLAAALVVAACTVPVAAQNKSEADVLNEFRAALRGADGGPPRELNQWATGAAPAPCVGNATQWPGVKHCVNGRVLVLKLEGLQLQGAAPDLGLLAPLQALRSLSLGNNSLTGAFPDVSALPALRFLFLFQNRLAGEIPDGAFAALRGLQKLNLSGNAFSGPIPSSIASSGHLLSVDLSNNNFSGPIPEGLQKLGANLKIQGELSSRHGFFLSLTWSFLFDACLVTFSLFLVWLLL
jgi:hypothetical protein